MKIDKNREYRILNLEVFKNDMDGIKQLLEKSGFNFRYSFSDSEKSFKNSITEFNPNIILCNLNQAEFSSLKALEIYKEMNLEIPFILITGNVSEEYAVEMMKKGIDDYLLKVNLHTLPQAIENSYNKREKEMLRKQAEIKLTQNESLLSKAQHIAHIGSWEFNIQTKKDIWSNEIFRILGLSSEEVEPSQDLFLSLIHPQDIAFVKKNIKQARKLLSDLKFSCCIVRKNNELRHVYIESKYETDEQGKPWLLNGILHDVTEKVLADEKKEFDKKNLSALINNTNDMMWSIDRNFKLITSNQAFNNMITLVSGKSITKGGTVFSEGFKENQINRFKEFYERAFLGEIFTENENYNSSWSEISFYPIYSDGEVMGTACYSRDITERKKTENDILLKNEQLRYQASHLQNIREHERTKLSREIHDELGQQLTALKMDIDWVLHKQDNSKKIVIVKLNEMLKMNDDIMSTIRKISFDLRPPIIDDLGLIAALEWKCNNFEEKTGILCHFISNIKERKFESNFSINTFRILQETLTNISKHAEAKSVAVAVSDSDTELFIEIVDDGKGINNENINNGTLGIIGMKERAALLGGSLVIEGTNNKGTVTRLKLPL